MNKTLTIKESAKQLGVTTATILNWEKQGHLSSYKYNNNLHFNAAQINHLKKMIETGQINRLNARANKKNSVTTFIPTEHLHNTEQINQLESIVSHINNFKLKTRESVFLLTLNILISEKIIDNLSLTDLLKHYNKKCSNLNIQQELNKWQTELSFPEDITNYQQLLEFSLPECNDPLGIIYQSLLDEGEKSKKGSYYTPSNVCMDMAGEYLNKIRGQAKILDLCCGTGQFLIAAGKQIKKMGRLLKPDCLWGYDIDPLAVQICRVNLMILFREFDFNPNIYQRNLIYNYSIDDKIRKYRKFDLILGNPPWGAEFHTEQLSFLKHRYPEILSMESYSYFVYIGLNLLRDGGFLSYLLPESILNVKSHKDIRNFILHSSEIVKIKHYSRLFSKVFTPVVQIDLQKKESDYLSDTVIQNGFTFKINAQRFLKNDDLIFDIHNTPEDIALLSGIFSISHQTLKNKADWALGIVTGNNNEFISSKKVKGYYKVLKGTDILPFRLRKAENYLNYDPKRLQQASPLSKFKISEKLIYKFISNKLVFAYDNQQHITLNSANVVIPKIEAYPMKAIAALFNSSVYQFIYSRKYFTHKVLRSHIENLPLPDLNKEELSLLEKYYDKLNRASLDEEIFRQKQTELDHIVFRLFNLNDSEADYLLNKIAKNS